MQIFNSSWLIHMLNKSSKTPQGKLLSLFDVLQDWVSAPNLSQENSTEVAEDNPDNYTALTAFLAKQARACGAENPTLLANHLILIALNATKQELAQANSQSLMHAKKAAHALLLSQTQSNRFFGQPPKLALAASVLLLITVSAIQWPFFAEQYQTLSPKIAIAYAELTHTDKPKTLKNPNITQASFAENNDLNTANSAITAADAVTMYAKYEQMRQGTCQYLEVLQIPDKHKTIYIENVVGSKLPTNLNDLAIANFYLEKVRCNFTPMLMANSK